MLTYSDWTGSGLAAATHFTETDDQCGLIPPHERSGPVVAEIGWQKPLILARSGQHDSWHVIDTTIHKETKISDEKRRTDPTYHDITIYQARDAWNRLRRYRSFWR